MTVEKKTKLSLRASKLTEEIDDRIVTIGVCDVILPCRAFRIDHKAAEVGKVSITAEFLLRLLKSVGKIREEAVATYFGYDLREMTFVLDEVESEDLVRRLDGWLSLTINGESVFRPGSDQPAIYEVEQRTSVYGFDLISLAPQPRTHLSIFETRLPELAILEKDRLSNVSGEVAHSFKRYYTELSASRSKTVSARRSLYSIDGVEPKERFSSVVRVLITARATTPSEAEADLTEWRADYELADREDIGIAAAGFVDALRVNRRSDDDQAYATMAAFAPEYFKEFLRRDGLSTDRYYRDALNRTGDARRDRQTIPILGSFFTHTNVRKLMDVAAYGLRGLNDTPETIYWLPPQMPYWGAASALPELVDHFKEALTKRNEENGLSVSRPQAIVLSQGSPAKWTEKAFDRGGHSDTLLLPGALEILLVPGAFVAVLVHAPFGPQSGHAVPLGYASFDATIVNRATDKLRNLAEAFGLSETEARDLSDLEEPELE